MLRLHSFNMGTIGVFIDDVIALCALLSGIPYIPEVHIMRKIVYSQTGKY